MQQTQDQASRQECPEPSNGIRWFGVTTRIPLIHTRLRWGEFLQGNLVSAATALALVPLLTGYFGLSFEEAVAMTFLHSTLLCVSWWVFGEPYAPGWITPALPFVMTLVLADPSQSPTERIQLMTALSLNFAFLLAVLGVTGLGARLVRIIPDVLKGAVILGAGLAAFIKVFDLSVEKNIFNSHPITASVAIGLSLLLAFSEPVQRLRLKYPLVARLAALGLLPGFVIGMLAGGLTGELTFEIESGFYLLPFGDLFAKVSPFAIGWPSLEMFINGLPIALIAYLLFFGDLVTGDALLKDAAKEKTDDELNINHSRTHLSMAIRNFLMGVIAPFFPTQGILWTGIHVVIVQRIREEKNKIRSLFDGISSYYLLGLPLIFCITPVVTGIKPMMPVALVLTLALTGFACTYVALSKARTNTEFGAMLMGGVFLALMEPWIGLLMAVVTVLLLVDLKARPAEET
ncbi:hypothetical protein [Parendozoicomonas haliclonae]|uniref:Permease family protein n=1 Tax=Parendozoicomonas haliclonae TaxID=1960125 RepID=A0A1X7ANV2_9GAMM|nr:hypothetical protein [Parendozoicomonas haliclonae]SMA49984.1 hypothetical protein EHSB41UT_03775 [Parendozoicomonas haliclonae]